MAIGIVMVPLARFICGDRHDNGAFREFIRGDRHDNDVFSEVYSC